MAKIEFDGQPVEISDPNQKNLVAEVSTKVTAVAIHVMSITPLLKAMCILLTHRILGLKWKKLVLLCCKTKCAHIFQKMTHVEYLKGDSETLFVCRFENCVMFALHTASSEELSQMLILNMFPFL